MWMTTHVGRQYLASISYKMRNALSNYCINNIIIIFPHVSRYVIHTCFIDNFVRCYKHIFFSNVAKKDASNLLFSVEECNVVCM